MGLCERSSRHCAAARPARRARYRRQRLPVLGGGAHRSCAADPRRPDEILQGSQGDLTPQVQTIMLARLLAERIRSGELTRFDAEFAHAWRLAADVLHSPELQIALRMVEACRYFAAGDVERGAALMESGHQAQLNLGTTWDEPGRFVLDSCRMR